ALALSACPPFVAGKAAVYVLDKSGYVKVRDSRNGFTALVQHSLPTAQEPLYAVERKPGAQCEGRRRALPAARDDLRSLPDQFRPRRRKDRSRPGRESERACLCRRRRHAARAHHRSRRAAHRPGSRRQRQDGVVSAMSEFIILGYPVSPFLRSVAMVLEEKGVPYQVRDFGPGGIGCEAHRQVHPFARIPAIDEGGYRLYETQAILRYIDAKFPDPPLQPVRPEAIGRMNQIIGINDCYLFPQVARTIVGERIMRPAFMGTTPD